MEELLGHSNTLLPRNFPLNRKHWSKLDSRTVFHGGAVGHVGSAPTFPLDISPVTFYTQLRDSGLLGFLGASLGHLAVLGPVQLKNALRKLI